MRFENDKNYKEVSLLDGLKALAENTKAKLYSDGLESNEYLYYDEIKGSVSKTDVLSVEIP